MRLADLILPYDNLLPEYFPGLAQIIRYIPPQFRPESLTVDFDKALQGDPVHNILLQEYDEVRLFSRRQMEEIPQVVVSGSVLNPGKYQLFDKMTVKDLVTLAGNVKRTTYLGEAEITRYIPSGLETHNERLLIDLQKALQDDPEHNLVLLPDDHLFIRSIPDSDEKFLVQVQGAVLFPGSYAITKGELLSSVLERAGGFTDKAYLRGAVFTRDSLKAIQRQQLEKLMFEQEQAIYRATAELAAGALDDAAATAAQTTLESRRQLLEKLRQAPVTGRMVVRFVELAAFRGTPSDVEVVSGDSIMIPENPRSVTILGNVYNPTSLAYAPGKTVSYYLSQVGGTKKNAEESEMFIVRANGTVVSKQQTGLGVKWDSEHWRWVFGGFNVTELYPGDAILVPEKVKTTDVMREVKDISTIIYQMALGAAAVASF
jgi:protein involved in polysaccharide export with SLBB domain